MDVHAIRKISAGEIKVQPGDPYSRNDEEDKLSVSASPAHQKFEVRCHAGSSGHLEATSEMLSVRIGQRIRRDGKEEFWSSLLVECKEQDDGSLAVEVAVFHPDWDDPLKIVSIQSHPDDRDSQKPMLYCDFEHKRL